MFLELKEGIGFLQSREHSGKKKKCVCVLCCFDLVQKWCVCCTSLLLMCECAHTGHNFTKSNDDVKHYNTVFQLRLQSLKMAFMVDVFGIPCDSNP